MIPGDCRQCRRLIDTAGTTLLQLDGLHFSMFFTQWLMLDAKTILSSSVVVRRCRSLSVVVGRHCRPRGRRAVQRRIAVEAWCALCRTDGGESVYVSGIQQISDRKVAGGGWHTAGEGQAFRPSGRTRWYDDPTWTVSLRCSQPLLQPNAARVDPEVVRRVVDPHPVA